MTKLTKFEELMLAPEDPAWDERVRDEFYRGCVIAYMVCLYGCWSVAVVAVAIDDVVSGVLVFLVPIGATLMLYRYCGRRGIDVEQLGSHFSKRRRFWSMASVYPLIIGFVGLFLWRVIDRKPEVGVATLIGAAVGGAVGAGAVIGIRRWLRRRHDAQEPDDTFE